MKRHAAQRNASARRAGKALALLTAFLTLCVGLVVSPVSPALANPSSGFTPGNIISDANFYQGTAMSAAQVQTFLNQRVPRCTIGDPGKPAGGTYYFPGGGSTKLATKCLKDAVLPTRSMAANPYCSTYVGRAGESAATIIQKVGQACGISQRVLLVMLEKEQSLVTDTFPAQHQFDRAMGYACPDSGPGGSANCNTQYYGFFNQVYYAAWQYKVYRALPDNYRYKPFQNNTIQWHPNLGCGTSNVYIENRATASLYIYTPYRPNQAALNAGWGTGDACSSYGNRNFYNFYNTWFGSPGLTVHVRLQSAYDAAGGSDGRLGLPVSPASIYANGAVGQGFEGGSMYWSAGAGAHAIYTTPIRDHYWDSGSWKGPLGFPSGKENQYRDGGVGQGFVGGSIYAGPKTGAVIVRGGIRDEFWRRGSISGILGYPVSPESIYRDGGRGQGFEHGSIYWSSATGGKTVAGSVRDAYWKTGSVSGRLGYPTGNVNTYASGGVGQAFVGGSIYGRNGKEAFPLTGALLTRYWAQRSTTGVLGYPTGGMLTYRDGGHGQPFEGGSLYQAPGGNAWEVTGPTLRRYWAIKSGAGVVGYPVESSVEIRAGVTVQRFERGAIYQVSKDSAWEVYGALLEAYQARGAHLGELGLPAGPQQNGPAGTSQSFEGGVLSIDAHGNVSVRLLRENQRAQASVDPVDVPQAVPDEEPGEAEDGTPAGGEPGASPEAETGAEDDPTDDRRTETSRETPGDRLSDAESD